MTPAIELSENRRHTISLLTASLSKRFPVRILTAAALCLASTWVHAALTITVGSITLTAPEISTTSTVQIHVNNDNSPVPVGALDFFIEVEAGGPAIQSVNLLTGTIFESNNNGQNPFIGNTTHLQGWSVDGVSPPEIPTGQSLVGSVTFDTTGVAPGDYTLKLVATGFGDTAYVEPIAPFDSLVMEINNGSLTVVPEPSHTALAGVALLAFGLWRRCARRIKSAS